MACLQSLSRPQVSSGARNGNHDKVSVIDVQLMRQQLGEINQGIRDSYGKPLVNGDIALHANLQQGGEVLIAMNAIEALELARQLITKASAQLQHVTG